MRAVLLCPWETQSKAKEEEQEMNGQKLKALIVQNYETQSVLAEALGLPVSALNARINGHTEFRRSEINAIRERYHLSPEETINIFFEKVVS